MKKNKIKKNQTIKIIVKGGVVVEVTNLPSGWDYQIDDKDEKCV